MTFQNVYKKKITNVAVCMIKLICLPKGYILTYPVHVVLEYICFHVFNVYNASFIELFNFYCIYIYIFIMNKDCMFHISTAIMPFDM